MKPWCRGRVSPGRSLVKIVTLAITMASSSPIVVMAQSQPPPELERLAYFEGNWLCRQPANNTDPSGEFIWNVNLGLNNFWYLGTVIQTQPKKDSQPINSREFLGYDVVANKLIRSVIVGNGTSYQVTADDWQNNQLVWTGSIIRKGKLSSIRQITVQDSPNKFTTTYFFPSESAKWLPVVNETCDRTKP